MASVYDVGTRAWQPDAAEGWVASELVNKEIQGDKAQLTFRLENGEVSFIHSPSRNYQDAHALHGLVGKSSDCHCRVTGERK